MTGWKSTAGGEEFSREQREGGSAGRVVGADFLMTISWAVSPHPHRVAHFKYHETVPKSTISWYLKCAHKRGERAQEVEGKSTISWYLKCATRWG